MPLALKLLIGALALAAAAAAFVLVPAHLQVRQVEPALPSDAELRDLAAAPGGPVRVRYLTTASQELPGRLLGHVVFLIEWADGRLFMIDAGMDRDAAAEFAELMSMIGGAGDPSYHGSVPELLGEDVQRVRGAGFTHLHIDHTQGLIPFCEARGPGAGLVQTPTQAELHNLHTREGAEIVATSCLQPLPLEGDRLMRVPGFPGLGIAELGGHTPGSTLFAANVAGHLWLFSGDTTNNKENLLDNVGKGFAYSYLMVPENTARTEVLRKWLAQLDARADTTVVVSHDLGALRTSGLQPYSR